MKPILIAATLIAILGAVVGAAASHGARPLHDELRWSENSAAWTRPAGQPQSQAQHGANA
jgi:hypothetical protein